LKAKSNLTTKREKMCNKRDSEKDKVNLREWLEKRKKLEKSLNK